MSKSNTDPGTIKVGINSQALVVDSRNQVDFRNQRIAVEDAALRDMAASYQVTQQEMMEVINTISTAKQEFNRRRDDYLQQRTQPVSFSVAAYQKSLSEMLLVDEVDQLKMHKSENIQSYLRRIATPCAVCGKRPGIWVDHRLQRREFYIRMECHNEVEMRVVRDIDLKIPNSLLLDLIPFSRPAQPAKQKVKSPVIIISSKRAITLED